MNLEVQHIPAEWRSLLDDLQGKYPRLAIAGGSLRDLDHGVIPKDLDIFVEAEDMDETSEINLLLGGCDLDTDRSYPESMPELLTVTEPKVSPLEIPVQFIFCKWNIDYIWERFDYGLCQIAFDGTQVSRSVCYDRGRNEKVFELVRCRSEAALASSVRRYARWRERYPEHGWRLGCNLNMGVGMGQGVETDE